MQMAQYNEYLVSTVDTDGLVLKHQGISSYNAGYITVHHQLFMGSQTLSKVIYWGTGLIQFHIIYLIYCKNKNIGAFVLIQLAQ